MDGFPLHLGIMLSHAIDFQTDSSQHPPQMLALWIAASELDEITMIAIAIASI
jgi:hypothetical protein